VAVTRSSLAMKISHDIRAALEACAVAENVTVTYVTERALRLHLAALGFMPPPGPPPKPRKRSELSKRALRSAPEREGAAMT
jgi:hypothetical protein